MKNVLKFSFSFLIVGHPMISYDCIEFMQFEQEYFGSDIPSQCSISGVRDVVIFPTLSFNCLIILK